MIQIDPLPENGTAREISEFLVDHWPLWKLDKALKGDGIEIVKASFRTGWVKLHVNWYDAESQWKHKVTATAIRDILAVRANMQELYFNHWQVIRPEYMRNSAWAETLNEAGREAIVYFRTEWDAQNIFDLAQVNSPSEVNSIILANSFKMMEKEGKHDMD